LSRLVRLVASAIAMRSAASFRSLSAADSAIAPMGTLRPPVPLTAGSDGASGAVGGSGAHAVIRLVNTAEAQ
jgi:hypothetical protein